MTTPLTSQSHRLNTRGRDQGGGSDRKTVALTCHLMVDSAHLGIQDLNHRTQTKHEDLRGPTTDICVSAASRIIHTVKHRKEESSKAATTRMPRPAHARRFRLQLRANRGADDFRQKIFVPGDVITPLPAVHTPKRAEGTGTAWNAQIYVPERPHSSDITPSVSMSITKEEKKQQAQREPKSRFQALQDLDEERTHELTPLSPLRDSSRFQRLRPPLPMYDSYTTSTSSPNSVPRLQHREDSIGKEFQLQVAPLQVPQDEPEKQQEQQQEHQPPHMLSMACNHTDNTMTTEDDDTIASFFILDDDISEVTWEGDWDFHKHQHELYQYHQYQRQQELLLQQQQEQTTNDGGKNGVPSWNRFLRSNRDRLETANTDGASTAAMHMTVPSFISVAVLTHHHQ